MMMASFNNATTKVDIGLKSNGGHKNINIKIGYAFLGITPHK